MLTTNRCTCHVRKRCVLVANLSHPLSVNKSYVRATAHLSATGKEHFVPVRVIDVDFIRSDSNNRALTVSETFLLLNCAKRLTIFLMHSNNLPVVLAPAVSNDVQVKLMPISQCCKLRTGKASKRMQLESVDTQANDI